MRTAVASLLGLLLLGLLAFLLLRRTGPDAPSPPPPPPEPSPSLAATRASLERRAGQFEDERDVKCWTSFKQLETYVAGCQLAPRTTHLKSRVVQDLLDQIWSRASEEATAGATGATGATEASGASGATIDAATLERAARAAITWEASEPIEYRLELDGRTLVLPYQDVSNYLGTVEPIRVLQALARRVAEVDPGRAELDEEALDLATHLAALLSTAVLKEANRAARAANHATILDEDVLAADAALAAGTGLAAHDPARWPDRPAGGSAAGDAATGGDALAAMRTTIEQKIHALATFNRMYSDEKLGREFDEDISDLEDEWAGLPLEPDARRAYKEQYMVRLARDLMRAAAREHAGSASISGPQLLATVQRLYPHVTSFSGLVSVFPDSPDFGDAWVEEFQGDGFRDSGWHWKTLGLAVDDLERRGEELPVLDVYALEELSEFLAIYAVALLKLSGEAARRWERDTVDMNALKQASDVFDKNSREHEIEDRRRGGPAPLAAQPNRLPDGREQVLAELRRVYIAEYFSDVAQGSGLDFVHAVAPDVHAARFSGEGKMRPLYGAVPGDELPTPGVDPADFPDHPLGIAGGGVAVEDVDGDGRLDVYLVSGGQDRLFRNLGELRFADVTEAAGLAGRAEEGRCALFGDVDGDGDPDLFVTAYRAPDRLFRNRGDGTFDEVTEAAGFPLEGLSTSHAAAFLDFENDGDLDLYVASFGDWMAGIYPKIAHNSRNAEPNRLWLNRGDGTFEDATERTGAGDRGWGHAVSHLDIDGDGFQDVYVANDFGEDVLLLNRRGERFVDGTPPALRLKFFHGMGVGLSDFNADGVEDVYVSNIAMFSFVSKFIQPDASTPITVTARTNENLRMIEANLFLVSDGDGFADGADAYFDRTPSGCGWAWDPDFLDFDNDGQEDLYVVNGREPNLTYDRERNVLFKQWRGHFYDVSRESGANVAANARGTAYADLDGDGDLDVVVNNYLDAPSLLRNNLQRHHWLRLRLEGRASNPEAVGARVLLHAGGADGRVQSRTVRGGSGFLSKDPYAVHFGLGEQESVERVEIAWPSGRRQTLEAPEVDREHRIVEPE